MAESMFNPGEEKKKKFKVMMDLKQLRGTAHMPKLETFALQRSEVIPPSPRKSFSPRKSLSPPNGGSPGHYSKMTKSHFVKNTERKPFRRQKYVRQQLRIEDI